MSDQNQIDWEKGTIQEPNQIDWDNGQISQPKEKKDKGFLGQAKDHAVSFFGKGTVGVGEVAVGLSNMMSDGATGKILSEKLGYDPKAAKNVMTGWQSEQYQQQLKDSANIGNRKIEEGDDFATKVGKKFDNAVDITKNAISNPSLITNTVAESLPSMFLGGALGRVSGIANPVVAGSVGEAAVMAGSQAEQIRQETVDGRLTADQSLAGATTGALGGAIGAFGGWVANKVFKVADIDTALQTGRLTREQIGEATSKVKAKDLPLPVVKGAISEGFLEELPQSVSEQILQNLALDKPWHDGVEDAAVMGTLAGMVMGGAVSGAGKTGDWFVNRHNPTIQELSERQQQRQWDQEDNITQQRLQDYYNLRSQQEQEKNWNEHDDPKSLADLSHYINNQKGRFLNQPIEEMGNLGNRIGYHPDEVDLNHQLAVPKDVIQVSPNGEAWTSEQRHGIQQEKNDRRLRGENWVDVTPIPKKSEQLGINPNDGPMSSAAALAVDTGASPVAQLGYTEQQQEQEQGNTPISDAVPSNYQSLLRSQSDGQPFDARFEDATVQQGNTQADNAVESISQQYDANAADAMGGGIETDRAKTTTAQTVQPILGQDGKNKWFGNQEKAQAFIDKKKLGNDYQVVQDGKRFEIQPKSQVAQTQNDNLNNQNSILNSQNTSLDAQNNTDKSQTSGIADQLAQLEQNFNAIKGNSLKQAIEKSKIKKKIDQLKSQQPEITTAPFGSEKIQKQYGDTAESVMSDIEILGDDFTIDLRDKNKKTNALNNPNYNAVQKADGSVEIVGMKHPTTGEWVGKKPNAMSIDENAHQAATSSQNNTPEPTQAQIEAGNYKKGHIKVHGLDISIENPKGSERRGTDPNGKEWAHTMSDHYGYIKRTKGADNEHIDTYIGNNPDSNQVFIVDQVDQKSGNFDEHKVMLGFDSQEEAATAYKSNFDKGWKVGPIHNMDMEQFKDWLKNKDTSKPAIQKNVKDSIENIRAEKIRQKDLADMHNSVYGLATDEQLQESLKHLNKEIKKAQRQSENEVVNGKRSTRKAVASGALDRFLKNRVDLETYIKARKNGELKQRNKKIDDYSRDKLKPDNERKGVSPLDTTFIPLSVVSATRRVLSVLQHLKMTATQDASFSGRINVSLNDRIRVNKVGDMNTYGFSVQVISSFSDLPKVIQNDATYQDENGKTQNYDVSGVWHNGTLYVVADQIYGDPEKQLTTFDAYEELLAHEIVGHFGVQQIFGREYKTKLQQLFNALGGLEGIRKIAKDNGVNMQQFESAYIEPYIQGVKDEIYTEYDVQQALVGELFAFVAQNAEKKPFVRQKLKEVLGYIRQWFRDRGFDKFLSRYNDADLMMFLAEARKAVVDQRYFGKYKDQKIETKQDSNIPQYNRNIKPTTPIAIQSDSEIGQTHFIPSHLMDSVNKLGDVVDDLALMRTEGVEYDHDYAVQLLNKIATLNPNIEVIFTRNPKLATGLSEGGYYPFSQDGTEKIYIYPQGNWESDILSLVNHELVHAVTYQAIAQNKVTKDDLNFLKKMSETLRNWMFKNPMALDEWIEYRFDYGINDQYHNELIAVFTAEFDVRQSFSSLQEQLFNESKEQATNFAGTQKNDHAEFQQTPSRDPASTERSSSASRESAENRASQSERQNNSNRTRETRTQVHFLDEFDDIVQRIMALNHEQHKQNRNAEKNKDKPLYSRQSASNSGSTIQQVRNVLVNRFGKETIDELERQGKLEIIQDYQVEGVEGFYHNGKAVLVASNLTAESTVPTFLHELGGHAGFQNMMNQKQYDELMNQFNKLVEQGNPVAMAAKVLAEREQGSERQQLEYLPYLLTLSATMQQRNVLQRNALQKLINNIISYVKVWVFDHFGINLNLNPSDMLALSERMIGQIKHQSSLDLVRQKYHGTHQWMKAPNGAATNLSEQQWLQVRTPEFKKWFGDWENDAANASQVLDENGEPKVVYHGTASEFNEFKQGHGILGDGIYLTDSFDTADVYANIRGKNGFVLPLFVNIRNAFQTTANVSRDEIVKATSTGKYQGVIHHFDDQEYIVALEPNQVKMAEGNTGTFNSESADIRFSRSSNYDDITNRIANGFKNLPKTGDWINKKGVDWLKIGLGLLSRRHLTEVYGKLLPPLNKYNELAAQMDADKNDIAANADNIVREWSKLKDEEALANVMHDATLAQIDPAKPHQPGDDKVKYQQLLHAYNNLSPEAQAMYKRARNAYSGHYAKVREAIRERILRSALSSQKKSDLLKNIEGSFGQIKGVYFPLARFGEYIIVMRNKNGDVESVSRAETNNEAESIRSELMKKYPQFKVDPVKLDKEYNASRDGVGRGFMSELFNEVENLGLSTEARAEFEDTLSQLYLSSMPDLSWAKHGIHRKGTAGFSQDARRAFAQHMFSGANYLGKLRYGDQLAQQLTDMQKHADNEFNKDIGYDQRSAQRVISEMEKRHELLMNPKGNPLSSFLTSVGFMYYMGLSPAAAMVNLSQTALIAYPIMGAKWGFDKAGKELLKASQDFGIGLKSGYKTPDFSNLEGFKNSVGDIYNPDIASILKGDELVAYEEAVKRGVIDVTQAHDLAGIAQGEDSKVMWYFRPAMRLASGMFHHAERFNREVTFIAAYRLARQHVSTNGSKATHSEAFEQAIDSVYKGHFDYSTGNRARFMQGNIAKVVLLFKQYAQNMIYTLVRNAHQSIYALDPKEQKEARRALAGILGMTTLAAGAIGLPITGMLFTASVLIAKKSKLGSAAFFAAWAVGFFGAADGDDDDPYELEIVIRNWLADIHPKFADLVFGGLPRAFSPVDLSGRVGLNNLIFPDVQDGLEGADWAKGMQSALLGPVVGIGTNIAKGFQEINDGDYGRGIETMLPVVLKNAMKSMRFANEGVLTKNKDVIHNEEVTAVELFSQAIGFSPSDIKTSMEGRSAIYKYKTKLSKHRSELMHKWVVARQNDDSDGMNKAWAEILKFNENVSEKNPKMRINRMNLMQSYKATERKAKETGDGGVYLTKRQKGAEEQGGFAFNR
ncbi:PLxRFG domain-containing protein [Acinetobacter sp. 251-1]|uniref:PLxRFG domain-containing protein n=1 Tax=Acinetobacter sp. 251-1 TaxID=2746720 RepID=UPI0025754EFB|nr:PLxRFG domain-containing protein [Acinetobacter sp. 251-1]